MKRTSKTGSNPVVFLSPMRPVFSITNRLRHVTFDIIGSGDTSKLTLKYRTIEIAKAQRKILLKAKNAHAVTSERLFAAIVGVIISGQNAPS